MSLLSRTASAATNSRPSMELDMESSRTRSTGSAEVPTVPRTQAGPVEGMTDATASEITPARSGVRLSDAERLTLARIKRNRRQGWMASFEEFDFLLEILERMAR